MMTRYQENHRSQRKRMKGVLGTICVLSWLFLPPIRLCQKSFSLQVLCMCIKRYCQLLYFRCVPLSKKMNEDVNIWKEAVWVLLKPWSLVPFILDHIQYLLLTAAFLTFTLYVTVHIMDSQAAEDKGPLFFLFFLFRPFK